MEIASKSYRYRIFTIPFFLLLNCLSFFDVYGIEVSGSVSGDWTLPNSPYIVTADATVPDGESLTIQPGVEIKFRTGSADLFVDGVLNAMGTAALPITFTTENPDPAPLQWGSILFRNTNGEEVSRLEHCHLSYGSGFRREMIQINDSKVEMRHCEISNSGTIGINILNANPVIADCQFDDNVSYAMAMTPGASPSFSGNQANGNGADVIGVHGGVITGDVQWVRDTLPYRVINDVTVLVEGQLTIAPGVVVEFQDTSDDLFIDGTLIAEGNASNRIRFTSSKTEKAPNQWGAVLIRDTSNDVETRLNYCDFEYGGAFRAELLALQQSSPTVENCRFSNSRDRGVTLQGSSSRIAFNAFQSNTGYAIVMDLASFPVFEQNSVDGNGSDSIGVEGGTLATSGRWVRDNIPYTIMHDVIVGVESTLTIDPGGIVQFQDVSDDLIVDGSLVAIGTVDQPIRFTSDEAERAPNQWGFVWFRDPGSDEASVLQHCHFEYGGAFRNEMLRLQDASIRVESCVFQSSRERGLTLLNSQASVIHCQFLNNADYAIVMDVNSFPAFSGNSATNNAEGIGNAIGILGGTLNMDGTWVRDSIPYTILNDVSISEASNLTIAPGVTLQFQNPADDLFVDGTLIAEGTEELPIIFTSNEQVKAPNQWGFVWIRDTSPDESTIFKYCHFEFGSSFRDEMLRIQDASPRVEHCLFQASRVRGITLLNSNATVANCQFLNNSNYALVMTPGSFPLVSGNQAAGNAGGIGDAIGILGGTLTVSGNLLKDAIPYSIIDDVVIGEDATLTIASGTTMQFRDPNDDLIVVGALRAAGTKTLPILFTSDEATKAPGQWGRIFVRDASRDEDTLFENVLLEYGGGFQDAQLVLEQASPSMTRLSSRFSRQDGLYMTGSNPTINQSRFEDNLRAGIRAATGSSPVIRGSTFLNNTGHGVENTDRSLTIDANGNFWGDPSGPLDTLNQDGLDQLNEDSGGESVSEYVQWANPLIQDIPFISLEPEIQIDPASLDFGEVALNQSLQKSITIRSTGNFLLTIQSLTLSDSAFAVEDQTLPWFITAGEESLLTVIFTPGTTGLIEGTLTIRSSDFRNDPLEINLRGTGTIDGQGGTGGSNIATFDVDAEGWKGVSFRVGGPYEQITGGPWDVTHETEGGNPGGHIMLNDPDGHGAYFQAPGSFLGNQLHRYDETLHFDLRISPVSPVFEAPDVILIGAGLTLLYNAEPTPGTDWISYEVPLGVSGPWVVDGTTDLATEEQMRLVLGQLEALRIRGEFVAISSDITYLDNVGFGNGEPSPVKPAVRFEPESIDFGSVEIGGSKGVDIIVRNDGDGDLVIDNPSYTPDSPFEGLSDPLPITLESGQETTFLAIFRPEAVGDFTGQFRFKTNDPEMPKVVIPLNGISAAPADWAPVPLTAISQPDGTLRLLWSTDQSDIELEFTNWLNAPANWEKYVGEIQRNGFDYWTDVIFDGMHRFYKLSNDTMSDGGDEPTDSSILTASGNVSPSEGGVISSSDSTFIFEVPPGAVDEPTTINIKYTSLDAPEDGVAFGEFEMEPTGLVFKEPGLMRVKLPRSPTNSEQLSVRSHSLNNPGRVVGRELSYFENIEDFNFNPEGQILEFKIMHFSQLTWDLENALNIVFEFPGKYLKKGDLIYTLTDAQPAGGGDWYPGHAALYLGTQNKSDSKNDGQTIIEATFSEGARIGPLYGANGVRFGTLDGFKKLQGHMFMGARRPLLFDVTAEERGNIANWAIDQLGRPYSIVLGGPWANLFDGPSTRNSISCVGLTEGAYENGIGKEITAELFQPILSPYRQFSYTKPVTSIELKEGELFELKIRGMMRVSGYYYNRPFVNHNVSISASTEDAQEFLERSETSFTPFGSLEIKPKQGDAGMILGYRFTINPILDGYEPVTRFFSIEIIKGENSDTFLRSETPMLSKSFNRLSLVTRDNASITVTDGDIDYSLSWVEPPLEVREGQLINMAITASATGAPSMLQGGLSPFRTELRGWILDPIEDSLLVNPSLDDPHAFVGYNLQPSDQCETGFRTCYEFQSMGHAQGIIVPRDFGGFRVSMAFSTFEKFNDGSRGMFERHWITWDYRRTVVGDD